jgi:NAD+ kinase
MKLAIISRKTGNIGASHDDIDYMVDTFAWNARVRGFTIFTDCKTYEHCTSLNNRTIHAVLDDRELRQEADVIVVFGGDGTMINAAKRFYGIPLLGINMGHLGFVSDVPKTLDHHLILDILSSVIQDAEKEVVWNPSSNYTIGKRTMVRTKVGKKSSFALNEIAIVQTNGRIVEFDVIINEEHAYRCRGDGLIISTPTGSTAYALSAGGSIIHPASRVIEVVPLTPQTLSCRPLIINDSSTVRVKIIKGENAMVSSDGIAFGSISSGEEITVSLDKTHHTKFIHPHIPEITYSYFGMLREKLNWQYLPGGQ